MAAVLRVKASQRAVKAPERATHAATPATAADVPPDWASELTRRPFSQGIETPQGLSMTYYSCPSHTFYKPFL